MPNESKDVLVVDDSKLLLTTLCHVLQDHGCKVRSASDGFAALENIRARVPDILLSDLNMTGMSGFELLSIMRRRFPAITVIAMSGAYSGSSAPPDVPADAFYAKGSSSMSELLQLVGTTVIGPRISRVPIWIPAIEMSTTACDVLLATCPECLRPFAFQPPQNVGDNKKVSCSHCAHCSDFVLVHHSLALDETPLFRLVRSGAIGRGLLAGFNPLLLHARREELR